MKIVEVNITQEATKNKNTRSKKKLQDATTDKQTNNWPIILFETEKKTGPGQIRPMTFASQAH